MLFSTNVQSFHTCLPNTGNYTLAANFQLTSESMQVNSYDCRHVE